MRVFTDGACSGNPGPGGYAVVYEPEIPGDEVKHWVCGQSKDTTNNRMELTAVLDALATIPLVVQDILKSDDRNITIVSDSLYVVNCATKVWKIKTNLDLWNDFEFLEKQCKLLGFKIDYQWVKGHNGNKLNELADDLAKVSVHTYVSSSV